MSMSGEHYRQPGTQSGMRRFRGCNRSNA